MGKVRFGKPNIWVTWITGLLSGEDHCAWAAHFKAHYTFEKVDNGFDTVGYNAQHKDLLNRRAEELRREGWVVTKEGQNAFKLHGDAAVLAGKPDIIAVRENVVRVVDVKTGQQRNAHWWQCAIYLAVLPRVRHDFNGMNLEAELYYADSGPAKIDGAAVTTEVQDRIWAQVREAAFAMPPEKVPSEQECGFCSIPTSECADRMTGAAASGETRDF